MALLRPVVALVVGVVIASLGGGAAAALTRGRRSPRRRGTDSDTDSGAQTQMDLDIAPVGASQSRKYLIASFPMLRQVAYCHLPDNVWRPLVIGMVSAPSGVAVDQQGSRLFVADPPNQVIWWYQLTRRPDGLLETVGQMAAAVEGVAARWVTVNSVGDLYFTGRVVNSTQDYDSVFRQDAAKIARGISVGPTEIYSRVNTGDTNPKAYSPSGIAVDPLYVYWGNQNAGTSSGSVIKGSSMYVGMAKDTRLTMLSNVTDEVRGVAATGSHVFYLSPTGVYGVLKNAPKAVGSPGAGLVAQGPPPGSEPDASGWNLTSITWDGDNTLYFSDATSGSILTVPAVNTMEHSVSKHADAPGVYDLAVIGFTRTREGTPGGAAPWAGRALLAFLLAAAALVAPLA